ncbi:MAG: YceI family protein [Flammeovirgaceae bacterium]|nr:YceI family protein [Flammeovirgaceae bacterium]
MRLGVCIILTCFFVNGNAQKFTTEKSQITFFSDAAIEDIAATNIKAAGLFDVSTSEIVFSVPIKDFEFEKSLMKEHFNEKYMESDKYPKSTFKGKVAGYDVSKPGKQTATAKGTLTIHGISKEVDIPGTVQFENGKVLIDAVFKVKLADYKIKIPQLLWQNIAEEVEVKLNFEFKAQS